ncbi:unnamed protein product [Boreogadus saida]
MAKGSKTTIQLRKRSTILLKEGVLSGGEEEDFDEIGLDAPKNNLWQMAPNSQEMLCTAHPEQQQKTKDWLAQSTYINFGGDTDSLLLDRNDFGFAEHVRQSKTLGSPV